jgi:hypothetical protein
MILSRPFELVTPTVDGDVLGVLARADQSFTAPQVRDLIGSHSVAGVRNALGRLTAQGIVDSALVGRTYSYRMNREHVAAPHIIGLALAGQEVVERLRTHLRTWKVPCEFAALFGSAATGTMSEDSDLDVFLVRADSVDIDTDDHWYDQISGLTKACSVWTGNDTQVAEASASELDDPGMEVLVDEIERASIVLVGPRDYLARRRRAAANR